MNAIKRVHFIEFNARVNTLSSSVLFPKYGTPLLTSILKERGYDSRMFLEGVSDMSLDGIMDCDAVCMPVYAPILTKVKACADAIRKRRPDLPIITGGPMACMYPQIVAGFSDYAVECEGDEVLPELLECLSNGGNTSIIRGLCYKNCSNGFVHTGERKPPAIPKTIPDLTLIEGFDPQARRVMNTLQTSRGCGFHCKFCPTSKLFGGVYRNRDIDSVIADIRAKMVYNPLFFVVDNSFLSNKARTTELLKRLADERLGAHLIIFERHEIGMDNDLLQLMRRAGVRCIIVGIESLSDENLQQYDKRQSKSDVIQSVNNILRNDIHVIGTFVLGGDGDTKETADDIIRFVKKSGISLNLFVMHDTETDESKGLLIPLSRRFHTYYQDEPRFLEAFDYLTGNFVTYFPKRMKPSTLQESIIKIQEQVFSHSNIFRFARSKRIFASTFGVGHGYSMMRSTRMIAEVVNGGYLDYLRKVEEGLYDENEVLMEDKLAEITSLPVPEPLEDHIDVESHKRATGLMILPGIMRYKIARGLMKLRGIRI